MTAFVICVGSSLLSKTADVTYIFFDVKLSFYKIKQKNDPCKTWVKISKVMPQPNNPFPPGKGGKPHGKMSKSFC